MKGSIYPATREPTEDEVARLAAIDAEIEAIAEAAGADSDGIEPLSDGRDPITEGMRAFNAEQVAVGGVALWAIGSAPCRDRMGPYVSILVVAVPLKKKT